ncbi:MAG: LEPR-XLL domain-containing protein [Verrucomicrobiales bacterium]|nr:LEPR-XLL domain-containing protein [Verrucomicrobiales bacterium]
MKSLLRRLFSSLDADTSSMPPAGSLAPQPGARAEVEALEPRVLFSGAPVEAPDQESGDSQPEAAPDAGESTEQGPVGGESGSGQTPAAVSGNAPVTLVSTGADLNDETLAAIADAAKQRWIEAGLSADQLAALDGVTYQIADLSGNALGKANGFTITIDRDAAGSNAWFIDSTPLADEEFDATGAALADGGAAGAYDLLSTVLHEQGHVIGLADVPGLGSDLMGGFLGTSYRRLPLSDQAHGGIVGMSLGDQFLMAPITGVTIEDFSSRPFADSCGKTAWQGTGMSSVER